MGCRFPGGINSSSNLWDLLYEQRTGQCKIPSSRFNVNAFYHPKGVDRPGSMNTMGGYFLEEDPRMFDPDFFGISPIEATYMDPQQRKLLEVVYEAFESAGATLSDVSGANIGCYVGNFTVDFQVIQTRDPEYMHRYSATGMGTTILGNRISHAFNLKGPSLVLDTACSSSLYCLHVACSALENRECDAAVVAGANLIQSPEQHLGTMKAGVLSGTSACHTFSSEADGYGRADGIGCLFLKRVSDAMRDNDPIRAVIRGTAVNSNGKTAGITLPSSEGQEAVIRKAYTRAGLELHNTSYVECHGTGTPVGDPIEVEGLSRVFGRSSGRTLRIGSVKTNLGHSEAASGISSVMKVALALEKDIIPATVNVGQINPRIRTDEWDIHVVRDNVPWPRDSIRRAGVNSFGYGGANAHAILESADPYVTVEAPRPRGPGARSKYLLPISATTESSLYQKVAGLRQYLDANSPNPEDFIYTVGHRRTHLPVRRTVLASWDNLADAFAAETLSAPQGAGSPLPGQFAFVFSGQGAQWPEMGKALFSEFQVFRQAIAAMDAVLQGLPHPPTWSLRDALLEPPATSQIHAVTRSQPACTALQVGLVMLLDSWDIQPSAVLGHSSGEIAAAFAAGRLTAAEAITVAYYRGYLVGMNCSDGAMMAAGLSQEQAQAEIQAASLDTRVTVACVNSPESVTVSGDRGAIEALSDSFAPRGIFARKLNTGGRAYHSAHMLAVADEYEALLSQTLQSLDISAKRPTGAVWYSSVTGEVQDGPADAGYWVSNLTNPVLFSTAVERVTQLGSHHLLEIGPHSALELPIKQTKDKLGVPDSQFPYASALVRTKNEVDTVLSLAGWIYASGHGISWNKVNGLSDQHRYNVLPDLPAYPWTYDRLLWNESRASEEFRHRKYPRHELIGSQVPGGNGMDLTWRNVLQLGDISWLVDHRLQETIVFPGAGYIAMAIEALRQAANLPDGSKPLIRLQNVHIVAALGVSSQPATANVELFTVLRPTPMTRASYAQDCWDFSISSYEDGGPTTRATGSISCSRTAGPLSGVCSTSDVALEQTQPRTWYENLLRVGLNFGPAFRSIQDFQVPRMRGDPICKTHAPLLRSWDEPDGFAQYVIHPITIDAMLQTAIVASTNGVTRNLRAKVPVSFRSITIQPPDLVVSKPCTIDSKARVVGLGTSDIDAELTAEDGQVVAQMENVKLAPYNPGTQVDSGDQRHPMLRVLWKPDAHGLGLMDPESFTAYLSEFAREAESEVKIEGLLKMGAVLSLLSHKNAALRILELGNENPEISNATINLLHGSAVFPRLLSYHTGCISEDGQVLGTSVDITTGLDAPAKAHNALREDSFDVVLLAAMETTDAYLATKLSVIKERISPGGVLLALSPSSGMLHAEQNGFDAIHSPLKNGSGRVILAHPFQKDRLTTVLEDRKVLVVDRGCNRLSCELASQLSRSLGQTVARLSLNEVTADLVPYGAVVFSLLESEKPLLANTTDYEMEKVKVITNNASKLVWVTSGNLLEGTKPEFALAYGLSRSIMMEQPSLQFYVFDIDDIEDQPARTARNLASVIGLNAPIVDYEFIQKKGVVHVSRFVPDDHLNSTFRQKQGDEILELPVEAAKPAQLTVGEVGNFDTLHFIQYSVPAVLEPTSVQVGLRTVGLNAKDIYVLGGKIETKDATSALEFCGVIERVGSSVVSLQPGDRVVVMAPAYFRTSQIVPEWACHKLLDDEPFGAMCTLPVAYTTALYALRDRGNLQAGESVLIHSAAGGVGIAAIQVAQQIGAEIYATVSTEDKKEYLVNTFGIRRDHIFSSRDASFREDILAATNGHGVDVVLNSLAGDLLHASWKCCSSFGRFIEIGKRDLLDCGRLEMEGFLKDTTFSAFDLSNLYYSKGPAQPKIWHHLLCEVIELYREKKITAFDPLKVFSVTEISEAYRYFSSRNRIGKVVISLDAPNATIRVKPQRFRSTFSPEKTYIMIGCLGGLGRSITRWMMTRGAKRFVFLGRSGTDRPSAQRLVEDLASSGVHCAVVRGDVCCRADVDKVVAAVDGQIGGVVQAAMGLNEALFTSMPNHYWHTGIDPKVQGTLNLHHAINGKDEALDFFLMTSSISGSVGTATESNYCAANFFLDQFARYRQSLGLPATSIGLGMISELGYLHENPEIEALLLRRGIQAINEDELLQILDIALSEAARIPHIYDRSAQVHILTGLEPFGLKELRKKGFEGTNPTLNDPRAVVLSRALDGERDLAMKGQSGRLPTEVSSALGMGSTLMDAVLAHVSKRFSNLVLLPLHKVDVDKPLAGYGMDSMIGAEFRSWFFQAFKVDISFLELLSKSVTVRRLSQAVVADIEPDL
ncbi:polyketide synthase [Aspergillus aurantiobrunneus]